MGVFTQTILSNGTITSNGNSAVFSNFSNNELSLVINVTGPVTGSTPTITFTIKEVDPGNQSTTLGASKSGAAITGVTTQIITIPNLTTGSVIISWVVTGGTPSFGGIYATLVDKPDTPYIYDLSGNGPAAVKSASTIAAAADPSLVTALSPNSPLPAGTNNIGSVNVSFNQQTPAASTLNALNAQQAIQINGLSTLQIQVASATGTHILAYESSMDSTNGTNGTWQSLYATPNLPQSILSTTPLAFNPNNVNFATPFTGQFFADVAGFTWVRVRVSTYTDGSSVITLILTPATIPTPVLASPSIITSPLAWLQTGTYALPTPYQTLRVTADPTSLFSDNFIGPVLDTNFRWNAPISSGAGASVSLGSNGGLIISPGTAAHNNTELSSQQSFQTFAVSLQVIGITVQLEAGGFITGAHRFWGLGTKKTSGYSATNPMQDGVGFEVDTAGNLNAVIYANGTQTFSTILSTNASLNLSFGLQISYQMFYRTGSDVWFFINSPEVAVATAFSGAGITFPTATALPLYCHAINGSSPLSGSLTFNIGNVSMGDLSGNQAPTTITGPQTSDQTNPFAATVFAAGELRVQQEPSPIFVETYEGGSLDTTNRWTSPTVSGGAPAIVYTAGQLTIGTGTTANGFTLLHSQFSFPQLYAGFLLSTFNILIESPVITNAYRFWGLGTTPGTPTAAAPLTDAVGFELGTDGYLKAIYFAGGTRNVVQDLSTTTGNRRQPTDASLHQYDIFFRDDKIYWTIDSLDNVVASFTPLKIGQEGPNHSALPLIMLAIANSTPPSSNATIVSESVFLSDTGHSSSTISDGQFGWLKATVKSAGTAVTAADTALVVSVSPNSTVAITQSPSNATTFTIIGQVTPGSSNTPIAINKTTYTEQTANFTGSVSSTSASDTSAGTGARTVTITYYDQAGSGSLTETVTLNGTTAVNLVNSNHSFIEKIVVATAGSGGSNVGTITLFTGSAGAGTTVGTIAVGDNQTFWAHHYVPLNKTDTICQMMIGTTGNQSGYCYLTQKAVLTVNSIEYQLTDRVVAAANSSSVVRVYYNPIKVTGFARIQMYVVPSGANTTFFGSFDCGDQ